MSKLPDGVQGFVRQGITVLEVDSKSAEYRNRKVKDLNRFDKRKFENLLVLTRPTERVKVLYK